MAKMLTVRLLAVAMLWSMQWAQAAPGEGGEAQSLPVNGTASAIPMPTLAGDVASKVPKSAHAGGKALPAITLQAFEPDSLARIVEAERGHPFWLVLWGLDCPYCIKSMRHIAARQKLDPRLRVITLATDDMEQADALRQHLQEIGIQGPAWVFGEASAQALRFAIDPAWRGEKPRAYYYDASGQRKALSGVINPDQLKP